MSYESQLPATPSLGAITWLQQLTQLGNTQFPTLLKSVIKEQMETHRARSVSISSTGASVPWSQGASPSWLDVLTDRKLSAPP